MTQLKTEGVASWVPVEGDTPWHRLGGSEPVRALAQKFYDLMEQHEPALTATHRLDEQGKVNAESRERFGMFLVFWLGGPQDYTEQHGHPRLRMRHNRVAVNEAMRDAWVRTMGRAMDAQGISGEVRGYLDKRFADVADFLRNTP